MSAFKYAACFIGIALAGITATEVHAKTPKPHKLAPPVICNMKNRLNIFIDEDNILWECNCQVLSKGFICHWQVIGGTDPVNARRRHLKPKRIVAYTIPAVVA